MEGGGFFPAGSSRALRLDPFALPISFRASDAGADGRMRTVELHREGVVLRRRVRGIPMAINLPVSAFLGVAIRLIAPEGTSAGSICVALEHRDPALSVPLFSAPDGDDVVAEWQSWAQVLRMPLLITDADGIIHQPFRCLGQIRVDIPVLRRRRRTALKRRRPSILLRRRPGVATLTPAIHREREIIARN